MAEPEIDLEPVIIEMWVEYAIGILVLFLRIFTRCYKVVGWRWQGDDYLAVAAVIFWTLETTSAQLITQKGSITGMTDEIALSLTPEQAQSIESGAKWLFAGWYIYVTMIWILKGIMMFFFARVTCSLPEKRLVNWGAAFVMAGYVATILSISFHCWPVSRLWQIYPYPGDDCSQNRGKYYALVVTNVTTDILIMAIPLPLLWRLQTTLAKKFGLGIMFCAGIFIVVCTLLRCIISLETPERLDLGLSWSIRETVVGIICTNAPSIKPLFAGLFGTTSQPPSQPTDLVTFGGSGSASQSRRQRLPDETDCGSQEFIVNPKGGQVSSFRDDHSSETDINGRGDNVQERRKFDNASHQDV